MFEGFSDPSLKIILKQIFLAQKSVHLKSVPSIRRYAVQDLGERRRRRRRRVVRGGVTRRFVVTQSRHRLRAAVRAFRKADVDLPEGPGELDDLLPLPVVGEHGGNLEPLDLHRLQHGHILVVEDQHPGSVLESLRVSVA